MSQSQQHATTCKPKRVMRLLCRNTDTPVRSRLRRRTLPRRDPRLPPFDPRQPLFWRAFSVA